MNERTIFLSALEKDPTDERSAYLDSACGDDSDLRQRLERLLEAHERDCQVLDSPLEPAAVATVDQAVDHTEAPGTQIGPYKLREQIGEGGFGVVYVAEQETPVARKVALKVIKPGMDTKEVIARFEAERQALALMNHPNIARVLDAGTTGEPEGFSPRSPLDPGPSTLGPSTGRPYFVMELVHGVPITEFCDAQKLSTSERLQLFVDVCRAVQHAHQKGIIHRDLKPGNVLVELHGRHGRSPRSSTSASPKRIEPAS